MRTSVINTCLKLGGGDPYEALELAIVATRMLGLEGEACACGCGARVFRKERGRKRRYYENSCRQLAYRERARAIS